MLTLYKRADCKSESVFIAGYEHGKKNDRSRFIVVEELPDGRKVKLSYNSERWDRDIMRGEFVVLDAPIKFDELPKESKIDKMVSDILSEKDEDESEESDIDGNEDKETL